MTNGTRLTTVDREEAVISLEELYERSSGDEQKVHIAGLGAVVIKPLTLEEGEGISKRIREPDGTVNTAKFTVLTIMKCLVRPKVPEKDLAVLLQQKNAKHFKEIARIIWEISGLSPETQKNESRVMPKGETSSPSPATSTDSHRS